MAEEVGIVGAEGLQHLTNQSKEGRTEKWAEEDETKSAKSNKDIKVCNSIEGTGTLATDEIGLKMVLFD